MFTFFNRLVYILSSLALDVICMILFYHATYVASLKLGWIGLFEDLLTYSTQEAQLLN